MVNVACFAFPSYLYQIAHLGDDDDEPEFSSATPLEEGDTFFFAPRPLRNLEEVDQLESLSPILNCQVKLIIAIHIISSQIMPFLLKHLVFEVLYLIVNFGNLASLTYTTAKKKRPNQLGYLVGIWL